MATEENSTTTIRSIAMVCCFVGLWAGLEWAGWKRVSETKDVVAIQTKQQKAFGGLSEVQQYELRLAELKSELLGLNVSRIGYWNNPDSQQTLTSQETWVYAQYALVPIVVENSSDFPIVLGDFLSPDAESAALQMQKLELVKNYGAGIHLFRNPRSQ